MEPESSTGPKKSRFKRDEPPLTAEPGGRPRLTQREREQRHAAVSVIRVGYMTHSRRVVHKH